MPKGRMLNRSISRSHRVARLSLECAILFSWCIPHLDRKGKIYADTATLKGIVVPYLDYMTLEIIDKCKTELHASGLAMLYGDGLYMFFLGFDHNQKIEHNERASEIPDPDPTEVDGYKKKYCPDKVGALSGHLPDKTPPKRERELKRKPKDKSTSPALQAALEKVSKSGFNIYALLTNTKAQLKQPPEFEFPEQVLLKVCEAYWREKDAIRQPWPWFVKVLSDEWFRWNTEQQIAQGEAYKKESVVPELVGLLRKLVT